MTLLHACGLPDTVWLASQSPRRKALLETLGLGVQVFLPHTGAAAEALEAPLPGEAALAYVRRVTSLKLDAAVNAMITQGITGGVVLAADTTVALGDTILGKPADAGEARSTLRSLSDTQHAVHTGVAVAALGHRLRTGFLQPMVCVQTSTVAVQALPEAFIDAYINSGEPFDKAGAYGIQGVFGQWVSHISGSHSGIMGLPVFETSALLRQAWALETSLSNTQ
ncbi:MAG: Maf family protein [Limnobacter sp.]|uniref:Maf family protein n=1 Tax=Limnobacter sp. TaxID=2003368 RepID=UPI00391BDB5F